MKKSAVVLFILISALFLTSCAAMLNGEYTSSTPHAVSDTGLSFEGSVVEVSSREDIKTAILGLINRGETYGKLRFSGYTGDIAHDLGEVCANIPNETPEGSYTVYYITYGLNLIVSYYEADISITYLRSLSELNAVRRFESAEELWNALRVAVKSRSGGFAFYSDGSFSEAAADAFIAELYYSVPELMYIPDLTADFYPGTGSPAIVDLSLSYPYSAAEINDRYEQADDAANELVESIEGLAGDEAVAAIAYALREYAEFDYEREELDDYSRWYNVYTSYGALVQKRAVGEGFAMAMQLLCEKLGAECVVVRGMMNNVNHAWNIVKLENGDYYHIDVSMLPESDPFFTDAELSSQYRWDQDSYPVCGGESLQSEPQEIDEPPVPEVTPTPPPVEENPPEEIKEPEPQEGDNNQESSDGPIVEPSDEPEEGETTPEEDEAPADEPEESGETETGEPSDEPEPTDEPEENGEADAPEDPRDAETEKDTDDQI